MIYLLSERLINQNYKNQRKELIILHAGRNLAWSYIWRRSNTNKNCSFIVHRSIISITVHFTRSNLKRKTKQHRNSFFHPISRGYFQSSQSTNRISAFPGPNQSSIRINLLARHPRRNSTTASIECFLSTIIRAYIYFLTWQPVSIGSW